MFCRNCGKELLGTPEICTNCGAKPMAGTGFCPGCGAPTTSLTEVCTNCGARVAKAIKEKTWKPTAAGILCIIVGVIVMVPAMAGALFFDYIGRWWWSLVGIPFIAAPLIIMGIIAIVAIVGGIYALRRRVWGLALAGSIALVVIGILPIFFTKEFIGFGILGILAIIFVIMGKREFR